VNGESTIFRLRWARGVSDKKTIYKSENMNQQRSSEMNNIGVECLERRDFRQALDCFRRALQQNHLDSEAFLLADQKTGNGPHRMIEPQAPLLLHSVGSCWLKPAPLLVGEPAPSAFQVVATSHEGGFLLYTQGLRISESPEGGPIFSHDPHEENIIHSAVIVFNLALVFHLASLQPGSPSRHKLLGKAQNLYQKSYMIMADLLKAHHGKATGCMFLDLLAMAAWNNQAHIQMECYFDHQSSGVLLWRLCSMALEVKRTIEHEKRVCMCSVQQQHY
jgi:hypothetical protein